MAIAGVVDEEIDVAVALHRRSHSTCSSLGSALTSSCTASAPLPLSLSMDSMLRAVAMALSPRSMEVLMDCSPNPLLHPVTSQTFGAVVTGSRTPLYDFPGWCDAIILVVSAMGFTYRHQAYAEDHS